MLILARNVNGEIKIGDDITITILDVQGKQVKVGIDAPKNLGVHRLEIYKKIQIEKNRGVKKSWQS